MDSFVFWKRDALVMEKEKIISFVNRNDQAAKQALFEEFYRKTFAVACYITRDRSASEDLTQDAFIKAFDRLDSLRQPEKFGVWIAAIVSNLARDYILRRRRLQFTSEPHHIRNSEADFDLADALVKREERGMVRAFLGRLSVEQRQVIVLRYYYEMSMEEIAANIGISTGTVKSRLHRAKKKLAMLMEPEDGFRSHPVKELHEKGGGLR